MLLRVLIHLELLHCLSHPTTLDYILSQSTHLMANNWTIFRVLFNAVDSAARYAITSNIEAFRIKCEKCFQKKTLRATAFTKPSLAFHLSCVKNKFSCIHCIGSFFYRSLSPGLMYHEQCLKLSKTTWVELNSQIFSFPNQFSMTFTEKAFKIRKMQGRIN